jgi:hypothetical protein
MLYTELIPAIIAVSYAVKSAFDYLKARERKQDRGRGKRRKK